MVDYIVSKTGPSQYPWVIKTENETIKSRHRTKENALSKLRSDTQFRGGHALVFYANKPGIDQSFVVGGAEKKDSGPHRGRTL